MNTDFGAAATTAMSFNALMKQTNLN